MTPAVLSEREALEIAREAAAALAAAAGEEAAASSSQKKATSSSSSSNKDEAASERSGKVWPRTRSMLSARREAIQ